MHLHYIQLDDRLDAVLAAERRAPESVRRDFRQRFVLSWLYHELALEGVCVTESDLRRALRGCDGDDYCDDVMLRTIRRFRRAIDTLNEQAFQRTPITFETLLGYHELLTGLSGREIWRSEEGATENYKHDVIDADDVEAELQVLCSDIERWSGMKHPIQIAIQVHYRLTQIWPFNKYSAAVARMVANQILVANGYSPAIIHAQERQRYYHAMHYDISRMHDLVMESLQQQIQSRERLFMTCNASRFEARAS
jgi:Fic family protein